MLIVDEYSSECRDNFQKNSWKNLGDLKNLLQKLKCYEYFVEINFRNRINYSLFNRLFHSPF